MKLVQNKRVPDTIRAGLRRSAPAPSCGQQVYGADLRRLAPVVPIAGRGRRRGQGS